MAQQSRQDNNTVPFIRSFISLYKGAETIIQDAGRTIALAVYTLMSKIPVSLPTTGTADEGNTGDGTCTGVALAAGDLPRVGTWVVECVTKIATGGVFKLEDPDGNIIVNDLTITLTAATTFIVNAAGMTFILTPGATDFEVGDKFTFAASAVAKWTAFDPTAVNGAQIPRGVYMGDEIAAATIVAGDVADAPILVGGACTVDADQLVMEAGDLDTVLAGGGTVRDALANIGIFTEDTVDIDELENS